MYARTRLPHLSIGDGFTFPRRAFPPSTPHSPAPVSPSPAGLESADGTFRNKAGGKIGGAKNHRGRTRGKDAIADTGKVMLDMLPAPGTSAHG
ncbi:hypothetical protein [Streptomyces noursei]|uniref:hypothetical protein n=1 Tax=Streptomyces noursei TaxID=1971 RepID=UPI00196371FC|nr:hypothetical protein [Streptomyces noursei]QRX96369.1 hypothetical protein JNO44_41225 [Streptomyces noursei]